jgi:hypothetical protein
MYNIVQGYEVIGKAKTKEEAYQFIEMDMQKQGVAYRKLGMSYPTLKGVAGHYEEKATVVIYQFRTLYFSTYMILKCKD